MLFFLYILIIILYQHPYELISLYALRLPAMYYYQALTLHQLSHLASEANLVQGELSG